MSNVYSSYTLSLYMHADKMELFFLGQASRSTKKRRKFKKNGQSFRLLCVRVYIHLSRCVLFIIFFFFFVFPFCLIISRKWELLRFKIEQIACYFTTDTHFCRIISVRLARKKVKLNFNFLRYLCLFIMQYNFVNRTTPTNPFSGVGQSVNHRITNKH